MFAYLVLNSDAYSSSLPPSNVLCLFVILFEVAESPYYAIETRKVASYLYRGSEDRLSTPDNSIGCNMSVVSSTVGARFLEQFKIILAFGCF